MVDYNNMVSIICPIYNEEKYITACIESILNQEYPFENLEVLFVDGMSTDKTRVIVEEYIAKYKFIRLLNNPHRIVPVAMNIGIEQAKGDIIIRLDAHAIYPVNYISRLVSKLEETAAANVGGVCKTLPVNDTMVCKAIATALCSSFGVGNSYFRIGVINDKWVDTVPFGCFRRDLFAKVGLYDEELVRNQDDELNARIIKQGGKILLISDLVITYYARDKISKVARMFYQYGLFKPLVNKKLGAPTTLRQFFPVSFLLGLILGIPLSFFNQYFAIIYVLAVSLYFILSFCFSMKEMRTQKDRRILCVLPIIFLTIHLSYGWGYLKGIYKILMKQPLGAKVNR